MRYSPVPQYAFHNVTDISPGFLDRLGVRFLMLDIDNTLTSYNEHSLSDKIMSWVEKMINSGIELYIVSNNRRKGRVESFSKTLGIGYINAARKPSPKGVLQAMTTRCYSADESALAGDQVFTDVLAANRAGAVSIVVFPRSFRNPLLALRYILEKPFRAACRNKRYKSLSGRP
jgi:HAD superfamily phosphatase (TIGR01668 family)